MVAERDAPRLGAELRGVEDVARERRPPADDVVANLGVLAAAGLVSLTDSAWPDALVAAAIAFMFLRSSLRVIADAWPQYRSTMQPAA